MQTTSGLLSYLDQRLRRPVTPWLSLLLVLLVVAAALALFAVGEMLAAHPDSMQVAPVRWIRSA